VGGALNRSLWEATTPPTAARAPLDGDLDVDIAIVGAGFTGLWTAYYLARADPGLRIAVCEAEVAGFGASGRNGGWCSALFPASSSSLAAMSDRTAALAQHRAMRASLHEVGRVLDEESIDAHFTRGGTVSLARSPAQLARARAEVDAARSWGRGEGEIQLLDAADAREVLAGSSVHGATYTPDCAAIHPLRLVRGLADTVVRLGVRLFEHTPVTSIGPGRLVTPTGAVRADVVVRATEGYTADLPGEHRRLVPIYSLIIATEPLGPELWERIGLRRRETFTDLRHLIVYGQRTADDRIVFGGRGAPYHFGSRIRPGFDRDDRVFGRLRETLVDLLPVLSGTSITHSWGGCLGVPRDWCASVGLDRGTGVAWAGGYVGDGVSTTNLAGRTLRDLVLERDTELVRLPWVNHRSPRWEPEPLRWLGVNAGLRAAAAADVEERLTKRMSRIARLVSSFVG
jgi:glycine/D-amino acid oxidase-like deaminating enzyme